MSVTWGLPAVSVPVLSKQATEIRPICSRTAPPFSSSPRRDCSGRGDDQRAGTADQEDRQTFVNPAAPFPAEQERRNHGDHGADRHHAWGIEAGKPVDEALRRRLRLLRLFDEAHHTRDRVVRGRGGHLHPQQAVAVDRAGEHARFPPLPDRRAFARDRRFVDRAFSGQDHTVRRYAVARPDLNRRPDFEAVRLYVPDLAIFFEASRLRNQFGQVLDAGAAGGDALEEFSDQEQEHDRCRLFGSPDDDGSYRCDRHQHFDRERRPGLGSGDCTSSDRNQTDQHREQECPMFRSRN